MLGLDAQGNMVFHVVKPVMSIFQVSSEQGNGVAPAGVDLQGLSDNTLVLPHMPGQALLEPGQLELPQVQVPGPVRPKDASPSREPVTGAASCSQMPFAEVSSLLDPNMKGSKAREWPVATTTATSVPAPG